jgi:hypothetical protein
VIGSNFHISHYLAKKTQEQTECLSPSRTLIMDFTMTHTRFGRTILHPIGQLTHIRRSAGDPDPDAALQTVVRGKILYFRQT